MSYCVVRIVKRSAILKPPILASSLRFSVVFLFYSGKGSALVDVKTGVYSRKSMPFTVKEKVLWRLLVEQ